MHIYNRFIFLSDCVYTLFAFFLSAASHQIQAVRSPPRGNYTRTQPQHASHIHNKHSMPYVNDYNRDQPPSKPTRAPHSTHIDISKPPVPSRKGRGKSNEPCPRDKCLSNHPSPYWKSNRCHGHPPPSEDDGGSTTSGSYVVDTNDLDLDPSGQLCSAVTV